MAGRARYGLQSLRHRQNGANTSEADVGELTYRTNDSFRVGVD
jgi:hypothetical protein